MNKANHCLKALVAALCLSGLSGMPGLAAAQEQEAPAAEALPVDEIRTFAEVFTKVKKDYVEELGDADLLESAIKGLLEGLDPHSSR